MPDVVDPRLVDVERRLQDVEALVAYRGSWTSDGRYAVGDAVVCSDALWIARRAPAIGQKPGDDAAWRLVDIRRREP